MTLGRGDKRVKQVFIVPIEDNGDEDLYSHLTDIVGFIGEGIGLTNLIKTIIIWPVRPRTCFHCKTIGKIPV